MSLVLVSDREASELSDLSLDDLARIANDEHAKLNAAIHAVIDHGIKCGEALLRAREMVEQGNWDIWCQANLLFSQGNASGFMRLAIYRDHLPDELRKPWRDPKGKLHQPSISRAITYLRGLPPIAGTGRKTKLMPDVQEEARRLRGQGLSYKAIGQMLGISHSAAHLACDPAARERRRKRINQRKKHIRQAERALFEKRRDEEMRRLKNTPQGQSYALLRKALEAAQSAFDQAGDEEARAHFKDAIWRMHQAEDQLVRGSKVDVPRFFPRYDHSR